MPIPKVFFRRNPLKVFNSIVSFVVIDVMDMFAVVWICDGEMKYS